jgi:hypothetical protein
VFDQLRDMLWCSLNLGVMKVVEEEAVQFEPCSFGPQQ